MFELHPRLAADCVRIGEFTLSLLLLMNDAQYPWCILVPRRPELRELYELDAADRAQLLAESCYLGERLLHGFQGDKLNVAALGNVVPQLHLHHIVRHVGDPAWPAPVWGRAPARPYTEEALAQRRMRLRELLTEGLRFY